MVSGKHGIEEKPVYPWSVDVPAEPERRYIFSIYSIAKWACAALFAAMIAAVAIVAHERSRSASPVVIYWDEQGSRFGGLPPASGNPHATERRVDEQQFMEEYFLRLYMARMFGSNEDSDWCDCRTSARPAGIFERGQKCFICNFSSQEVFHEASTTLRSAKKGAFRLGEVRRLDTRTIQPERGIAARIMGVQDRPGSTTSRWRADFSLGSESLSAYYTITSDSPNPMYSFSVTSANYAFDVGGGAK